MLRLAGIVTCLLTAACGWTAFAQVTARQGDPTEEEQVHRFRSPMILDLPLTVADPALWNKGQIRSSTEVSLRRYNCDGVTFADFAAEATKSRGASVKVSFAFILANEPGVDKLASGRFAIVSDDRELAAGVLMESDVEEGQRTSRQVSMTVSESDLRGHPTPTLRILLRVKNND
jgi:hypothetical protein